MQGRIIVIMTQTSGRPPDQGAVMGTLHHHPFLIRYQGGAGDHVVQIRAGRTVRSGVG